MNGGTIKEIIYLLFIATIFYFIVRIIFKIVKFNKMSKIGKGIYFTIFILLFYFFYKVIPPILFGNSKIVEGMSLADSLKGSKGSHSSSSGNIDYTKGWDTAQNFRDNYCSKNPIYVQSALFNDKTTQLQGGLMYGGRSEIFDSDKNTLTTDFSKAFMNNTNNGNNIDTSSFTKDNGCITNLQADVGVNASITQMCNPKCNFNFTSSNSNNSNNNNNSN
jgi:hypothetical protein